MHHVFSLPDSIFAIFCQPTVSIAIYIVELVNKFDDAFGDRRDCVHNTLTCKLFMGNLLH